MKSVQINKLCSQCLKSCSFNANIRLSRCSRFLALQGSQRPITGLMSDDSGKDGTLVLGRRYNRTKKTMAESGAMKGKASVNVTKAHTSESLAKEYGVSEKTILTKEPMSHV